MGQDYMQNAYNHEPGKSGKAVFLAFFVRIWNVELPTGRRPPIKVPMKLNAYVRVHSYDQEGVRVDEER